MGNQMFGIELVTATVARSDEMYVGSEMFAA
jgi:hypothetical protein